MKRKFLPVTVFFIIATAMIFTTRLNSHIVNPPPGNTDDPITTNTCSGQMGCHTGATKPNDTSILVLKIDTDSNFTSNTPLNDSFAYLPNTTYYVGFNLVSSTGRYGFQIDALTYSQSQAGAFTVTDATHTFLQSAFGGIQYMGHFHANTFKSWVFKWTSPAASTGPITFYFAYNTANGDSTPNGDSTYAGSFTIQPNTASGINPVSKYINHLNVFPNPAGADMGISFDVQQAALVNAQLYSLDGKIVKGLYEGQVSTGTFNRVFDVASLPAGIYILNLKIGETSTSQKIIKE